MDFVPIYYLSAQIITYPSSPFSPDTDMIECLTTKLNTKNELLRPSRIAWVPRTTLATLSLKWGF